MLLHIQYPDRKFDYISTVMLDHLIRTRTIQKFYRPSEARWVDIYLDPLRGEAIEYYDGLERRRNGLEPLRG